MERPRHRGEGDVLRGSEQALNSPSQRQPEPQLDPIDIFCPWASDRQKPLLRRLRRYHFSAVARVQRCQHRNARPLWWTAAAIAQDKMAARLAPEDLKEAIEQVSRLSVVANYIERSELADA